MITISQNKNKVRNLPVVVTGPSLLEETDVILLLGAHAVVEGGVPAVPEHVHPAVAVLGGPAHHGALSAAVLGAELPVGAAHHAGALLRGTSNLL